MWGQPCQAHSHSTLTTLIPPNPDQKVHPPPKSHHPKARFPLNPRKIIQKNDDIESHFAVSWLHRNSPERTHPERTHKERPMKKTVLTFGLISGAMISVLMAGSLLLANKIGPGHSMAIGYT